MEQKGNIEMIVNEIYCNVNGFLKLNDSKKTSYNQGGLNNEIQLSICNM